MMYFENLMVAFIFVNALLLIMDAFGWSLAQAPFITRTQILIVSA